MIARKEIERLPVLPAKARGRDKFIGRVRMHGDAIVLDVYEAGEMMVPDGEEKDARIECRWACDKKNYYTYVFAAGTWTNRTMYYATHGYYQAGQRQQGNRGEIPGRNRGRMAGRP